MRSPVSSDSAAKRTKSVLLIYFCAKEFAGLITHPPMLGHGFQ
jgi:hypothetical protein